MLDPKPVRINNRANGKTLHFSKSGQESKTRNSLPTGGKNHLGNRSCNFFFFCTLSPRRHTPESIPAESVLSRWQHYSWGKNIHFLEQNSCEETCLPCRGMLDSANALQALLLWLPPSYVTEQSRGDLSSWPREPTVTYSRDIYREAVILSFRRKHCSCLPSFQKETESRM